MTRRVRTLPLPHHHHHLPCPPTPTHTPTRPPWTVQYIKNSQSLKKLGLSYNAIGKAGCRALTAAINSNQSLKHLQLLPGNPVEEKDAKALAKALKRNNKFSIRSLLGLKDE